jgi:hypothetical protein
VIDSRIAVIGLLINAVAAAGYIRATVIGKAAPNRVSFAVWAAAPLIGVAVELHDGVGLTTLTTLGSGLGPLLIFGASFIGGHAPWQLRPFDYTCGVLSLGALVLWGITGHGEIAVFLSILADLLACAPTIRKAWMRPDTEVASTFALSAVNGMCGVAAAPSWSPSAMAWPLYLTLICVGLTLVIVLRRRIAARCVETFPAAA